MTIRSHFPSLLVAIALVLTVTACGGGEVEPTAERGDLLQEYFRSGDVKGDFVTGSGEDRIANLASMGSPDDFVGALFSAHPCDRPISVFGFTTECEVPDAARTGAEVLQRFALVKHDDGGLELLRLTVALEPGGPPVLYDAQGGTYPGGLPDFREHNDLLDESDQLLVGQPVTATDGKFELVVVTGQTGGGPAWVWWLVGGLGVVVVLGLVTWLLRKRRAATSTG